MVKKDEFTPEGEALGYISLDQATLKARTLAMQDEERYRTRLGWDELVWVVSSAETTDDYHRVVVQFRRPARGAEE